MPSLFDIPWWQQLLYALWCIGIYNFGEYLIVKWQKK